MDVKMVESMELAMGTSLVDWMAQTLDPVKGNWLAFLKVDMLENQRAVS